MPKVPPSLNSISGLSHRQVEEEDRRRRLEQVLCGLPLRPEAASKIADLARNLDEAFLLARVATAAKHKTRSANLNSAKQQLRYIESGANTLAKRLKAAHPNVINAWVDAEHAAGGYADRQEVMQEWLKLKRLLENAAKRANRACDEVAVLDTPEKRGRPTGHIADLVTVVAANVYEELTELRAVRSIDRDTGEPGGKFHHFLAEAFGVLGIEASPDHSNMRLQTKMRSPG